MPSRYESEQLAFTGPLLLRVTVYVAPSGLKTPLALLAAKQGEEKVSGAAGAGAAYLLGQGLCGVKGWGVGWRVKGRALG